MGSSNVITDNTGKQVSLTEYVPYGATNKQVGTYDPEFKFTGKELDATTGLYYYGARYYDTMTGRFTQGDNFQLDYTNYQSLKEKTNPNNPVLANRDKAREEKQKKLAEFLGKPQNLNIYSYGLNNPLRYTDPSGQTVWDVVNKAYIKVGQGAEKLYNNSNIAKTIMDHPYLTGGAIIGAGSLGAVLAWNMGLIGLGVAATAASQEGQQIEQESVKLLNSGIDITNKAITHINRDHTGVFNGINSVFNKGEDIIDLIRRTTQSPMIPQIGDKFARIVDMGRNIGVDRFTGQQTSVRNCYPFLGHNLDLS